MARACRACLRAIQEDKGWRISMSAWNLVKDLELDLSDFSIKQVQTLINDLDSGEIGAIVEDLRSIRERTGSIEKALELAIKIAEFVLTKGIKLI